MHQSDRQNLFSPVVLNAYRKIETDNTAFVLLGGERSYIDKAQALGLKNFYHVGFASSPEKIQNVLRGFNIYAHGRYDGEVCSSAIIEAMSNGTPVISHPSQINNGHFYQIRDCGFWCSSTEEYADAMRLLMDNKQLYQQKIQETTQVYETMFDYEKCIQQMIDVFRRV